MLRSNILSISLIILALLALLQLPAKQPSLTADSLSHENDELTADGNAELESEDIDLQADSISYNKKRNQVEASGNVRITDGEGRLITESASYTFTDKLLQSGGYRVGRPPAYLEGLKLKGTPSELTANDATLYYFEPEPFGLNVKAESVTFIKPETFILKNAVFRIGKIPFFYLPYLKQQSAESPIKIKASGGFTDNLGAYAQTEWILTQWSEILDPGITLDYYSQRGLLYGPQLDYHLSIPGIESKGQLRSGFIDDQKNAGVDNLLRSIDQNRHFLHWQHKQSIFNTLDVTGTLGWWSDSEVTRDFRSDLFDQSQDPDHFFEAVYRGENYMLSAFTRVRPNDFQVIQERLPEFRYDLLPNSLGNSGIYQESMASVAYLREKDPRGITAEIDSRRADFYYGLRKPYPVSSWLSLTPVVAARITHYEKTNTNKDRFTRLLGQIGFDLETGAHRTWNYQNAFWKIDKIRHSIRPIIQYRYVPEAQSGNTHIPQFDRRAVSTLLQPLDLANVRFIDDLHEIHTLRFGARNSLETQDDTYGSRELLGLDLFQDHLFSTRAGENDYGDLHTELRLSPAYWLQFNLYNRFNPEDLSAQETRSQLRLTDADEWSLDFETDNLQNQVDQYQIIYSVKLNEDYSFRPRWRYDARRETFTEQEYGLFTSLGNTWDIEYALSFKNGAQREDGVGFTVRIDLKQF